MPAPIARSTRWRSTPTATATRHTSTRVTRVVPFSVRLSTSTTRGWWTSPPSIAVVSAYWPVAVRTNAAYIAATPPAARIATASGASTWPAPGLRSADVRAVDVSGLGARAVIGGPPTKGDEDGSPLPRRAHFQARLSRAQPSLMRIVQGGGDHVAHVRRGAAQGEP